jgi:hypothetical protein
MTLRALLPKKQLYSSQYFQTALTGLKGSIVGKAAVGRPVPNLKSVLRDIRQILERTTAGRE